MPPPHISIIDDDIWAREGIKDLVASLGYRTLTFASAEEFWSPDASRRRPVSYVTYKCRG